MGLLGLEATGIELIEDRWKASCDALDRLRREEVVDCRDGIRFLHANVLDVDFSDADILFSTDIMWPEEVRKSVIRKAQHLQKGSLVITNKEIRGPGFEKVTELNLVTNWDTESTYRVHVVTGGHRWSPAGDSPAS